MAINSLSDILKNDVSAFAAGGGASDRLLLPELASPPAAPAAGNAIIYAEDNGTGLTRAAVRFNGTGPTVPFALQGGTRQFIDAEWYSLNGDGTDDTLVIRQIVADAISRGIMRIQFPAGRFGITPSAHSFTYRTDPDNPATEITVSKSIGIHFAASGLTLVGAGKRSTSSPTQGVATEFVWLGAANGSCFYAGGPGAEHNVTNLSFERFSIDMKHQSNNTANQVAATGGPTAFQGERMSNSYFDRVGLNDAWRGLHIHTSSFANVFDWLECYRPGQFGIMVECLSHKTTFYHPKVWGGPGTTAGGTNPIKNPTAAMVVGSDYINNGNSTHCSKFDMVSGDLEVHRAQTQLWLQDVRSFDITLYTESKHGTILTEETITLGEGTKTRVPKGGSISLYTIGNYDPVSPGPESGGRRVARLHAGHNIDIGGLLSAGLEVYTVQNPGATPNNDFKSIRFDNTSNKILTLPWTLGAGVPGVTVPVATTTVSRVAALSVPNISLTTFIPFDTEIIDESSMWSSGESLTVFANTGYKYVRIFGTVRFAISATGNRQVSVRRSNAGGSLGEVGGQGSPAHAGTTVQTSITFDTGRISAVAGDFYEIRVYQNSGAALDCWATVTAEMS